MGRGILCPFALYKSYKAFILIALVFQRAQHLEEICLHRTASSPERSAITLRSIRLNKLPRSKLRGISLGLASLGISVKRSKLRGIRPVSD